MSNMAYAQAVSRLRAIETKLLDRAKLDRMIDSKSILEAFKLLQETEYGNHMAMAKRPEDYENLLSSELKSLYELMYKVSPKKAVVDIMSIRYDYHNIKVLIKGNALKKDLSDLLIPVATIPVKELKDIIENKDYYDLNPIMREAIEVAEDIYSKEKDPQKIDIILDTYMYKNMLSIAQGINDDYLLKFIKINIDISNIKTLLRVKKQKKDREFLQFVMIEGGTIDVDSFIQMLNESNENIITKLDHTDYYEILKFGIEEFNKTGKLNLLEKLSDNFIMKFIKDAKYVSFGAEPLLAYIYAKENEIKIVRIIMVGKINNIATDVIKERLRDIYV
ncbi:V-type ATP synthase subunit C [Clostridium sediminicola]|uniref:V-type ATP synthase subunit C n=1 Tax=Clostridium sediminicola TaxID=3114879 RepID=UPI0031F1F4AE